MHGYQLILPGVLLSVLILGYRRMWSCANAYFFFCGDMMWMLPINAVYKYNSTFQLFGITSQ